MPIINRTPINTNNDVDHYEVLEERPEQVDKAIILSEIIILFQ